VEPLLSTPHIRVIPERCRSAWAAILTDKHSKVAELGPRKTEKYPMQRILEGNTMERST